MIPRSLIVLAAAFLPSSLAATISCQGAPAPAFPYRVADGWSATPILGNLSRPRGVVVDTKGNLLVLERGKGITGHKIDGNGCVKESKVVVEDPNLNHGIDVHPDGKAIVASYVLCFLPSSSGVLISPMHRTPDIAFQFDYNPDKMEATARKQLVTG